jgi:hypothetical protein
MLIFLPSGHIPSHLSPVTMKMKVLIIKTNCINVQCTQRMPHHKHNQPLTMSYLIPAHSLPQAPEIRELFSPFLSLSPDPVRFIIFCRVGITQKTATFTLCCLVVNRLPPSNLNQDRCPPPSCAIPLPRLKLLSGTNLSSSKNLLPSSGPPCWHGLISFHSLMHTCPPFYSNSRRRSILHEKCISHCTVSFSFSDLLACITGLS